jgi:hypothetical protein
LSTPIWKKNGNGIGVKFILREIQPFVCVIRLISERKNPRRNCGGDENQSVLI